MQVYSQPFRICEWVEGPTVTYGNAVGKSWTLYFRGQFQQRKFLLLDCLINQMNPHILCSESQISDGYLQNNWMNYVHVVVGNE